MTDILVTLEHPDGCIVDIRTHAKASIVGPLLIAMGEQGFIIPAAVDKKTVTIEFETEPKNAR